MWQVPIAAQKADPVFVVLFLIVWSVLMLTYVRYSLLIAPAALRRWADAEGYKILEQKHAGLFSRISLGAGSGHQVYRIVFRDGKGREFQGLVIVGTTMHWFWKSADVCPVELRWMRETPTLE